MLRSGDDYRASLRDGRAVWIEGEKVADVPSHPAFKPIVDARARIYDLAHAPALAEVLTYEAAGERRLIAHRLPRTAEDWRAKRAAVEATLDDLGGVVIRVGDETVGELWSLYDGQDVLNEVDPRFADNIRRHVARVEEGDVFHVSANTDPKGDRSKRPQEQDPDMLLHAVRETDAGIVVRGAKYETAAAYAHQAFVKPTIANWGDAELSDYAIGFVVPMNAKGLKHICRAGFAGRRPVADAPIASRFDEVDTLLVFDDVLIPWEDVLFYRHTRAASFIRSCLHRYSAFPFVQRIQRLAELMIGTALFNLRQTGLEQAAGGAREARGAGLLPRDDQRSSDRGNRGGRAEPGGPFDAQPVLALQRPRARLLAPAGDDAPDPRAVRRPDLPDAGLGELQEPRDRPWLDKFYSVNEAWRAEDRFKLLAFARDLLNSDYAGHRLTFELFAQSPPFAHLNAVFVNFDWQRPLDLVERAAGLSERVRGPRKA